MDLKAQGVSGKVKKKFLYQENWFYKVATSQIHLGHF